MLFEVARGEITERAMTAARVIEGLDVIEDQEPGGSFRGWDPAGEAFGFERGDEALGERIVVGVGAAAHAGGDAVSREPIAESAASVLDPAIAMVNQSRRRVFPRPGLLEGGQDQFGAQFVMTVMGEALPATAVESKS